MEVTEPRAPIKERDCETHRTDKRAPRAPMPFVLVTMVRAYAVCADCAEEFRRDDFLVRPMSEYLRGLEPNRRAAF